MGRKGGGGGKEGSDINYYDGMARRQVTFVQVTSILVVFSFRDATAAVEGAWG